MKSKSSTGTETPREALSRLAGFDVGEVDPKYLITPNGPNYLTTDTVLIKPWVQKPQNAPASQVKTLFQASFPVMATYLVNPKFFRMKPLITSGLN